MPPGTAPGQPVTLPQDVDVAATLPSTDPSLARFGGADEAHLVPVRPGTSTSTSPHLRNNYAPDHSVPTTNHHEPFMTYHEFGAQQQAEPDQFTGFELHPGAPLTWDWANPNGYSDFSNQYEPQGELVQELQAQSTATENDFSLPLPANLPEDSSFHSPRQYSSAPKATVDPQTSMGTKRKAESEPNSAVSHPGSLPVPSDSHPTKRANKSRSSSSASATSPIVATATASEATTKPTFPPDQNDRVTQSELHTSNELPKRRETGKGTGPQGRVIDVSRPRRVVESPGGYDVLPAGKVFPIQIGSELFRLSGASLSSDAPSYFSHFFREQIHSNQGRAGDVKTLYIDRDPNTFRDIVSHLQGYYITPRDGEHFVRLFADAQFYSLPRLTKQLFSTDIFIRIGGVPFQIPRDLFSSPGDSPNYFTLGFAQFFSTPSEVFPGLDRNALLRPPSIHPPSVPNRSGEIFQELVKMLQGYTVEIRSDTHRAQLLRDARYFHLKGLEQKLIPCHISYNLKRSKSEILIRLDDVRQSGVSFIPDSTSMSSSGDGSRAPSHSGISEDHVSPQPSLGGPQLRSGTVSYARPYTDDHSSTNVLILEISASESTTLHLPKIPPDVSGTPGPLAFHARATFRGSTLARITSLFSVIASKMGLPANQPLGLMMLQSGGGVAAQPVSPANSGLSERRVRVRIDVDCYIEINNLQVELAIDQTSGRVGLQHTETVAKGDARKWIWGGPKISDAQGNDDEEEEEEELVVTKAHWRLRVESVNGDPNKMQVVLYGARLEGYNEERDRNHSRKFLG